MRISDWSSDVCSSDLLRARLCGARELRLGGDRRARPAVLRRRAPRPVLRRAVPSRAVSRDRGAAAGQLSAVGAMSAARSEEHTSELQSLMRISYAVFCLKKKTRKY